MMKKLLQLASAVMLGAFVAACERCDEMSRDEMVARAREALSESAQQLGSFNDSGREFPANEFLRLTDADLQPLVVLQGGEVEGSLVLFEVSRNDSEWELGVAFNDYCQVTSVSWRATPQ
ncbi:hypothetical protein [Maricaulis sp.]|uniref:hypothetical protein n=1 Tax=Maricaulis sp. TaxID=1486257 RepID=UPI003A95460B